MKVGGEKIQQADLWVGSSGILGPQKGVDFLKIDGTMEPFPQVNLQHHHWLSNISQCCMLCQIIQQLTAELLSCF